MKCVCVCGCVVGPCGLQLCHLGVIRSLAVFALERLFHSSPDCKEGKLSNTRDALINRTCLAAMCLDLGLHQHVLPTHFLIISLFPWPSLCAPSHPQAIPCPSALKLTVFSRGFVGALGAREQRHEPKQAQRQSEV